MKGKTLPKTIGGTGRHLFLLLCFPKLSIFKTIHRYNNRIGGQFMECNSNRVFDLMHALKSTFVLLGHIYNKWIKVQVPSLYEQ